MSDTKNVKLGVCKVTFGGVDLGYTKGGVNVEVKTNTHKVMVDQFGDSEINEFIMGRTILAKVPLAETTIENLNAIMPGSSIALTAGAAATGSIGFPGQPAANDTVTIDGVIFKFVVGAPVGANQVTIGATAALTVTALAAAIAAHPDARLKLANFVGAAAALNVTYATDGVIGNVYTLAKTSAVLTVTAMSGGIDDKKRADVSTAVGVSLLDNAKPLLLHPIANATSNVSDDLLIPLAATPGAASFIYKIDAERIFSVEFSGYPDPNTKLLFSVGDPVAGS